MPDLQPRGRQVLFWASALGVFVAALLLLADILLPFVVGMVLAYFLDPLAARLQRLGMGRTAAALIVVAFGLATMVLALIVLAPLVAEQIRQLIAAWPADIERVKASIDSYMRERLGTDGHPVQGMIDKAFAQLSASWAGSAGTIASALWSRGLALVNVVSILLITPVVVFYLLVDWEPMLARLDGWLPREHASTIRSLARDINDAVSAFIRGQGIIAVILGVFYAIGLTLAGVPYGVLIGLATGILSFIPMVGWLTGVVLAAGIALTQGWPSYLPMVKAIAVLSAGMALDTAVLSPRLVGEKVGLHPVWLIFALFAFSYLLGFVGTLVAVPVAAAIAVLVRYGLKLYLASEIYTGKSTASASPAAHEDAR